MSIIVKGMEMPKNCAECVFRREINFEGYLWFDYHCSAKDKSFDWDDDDNKPNWCPLIAMQEENKEKTKKPKKPKKPSKAEILAVY